VGHDFEDSTQRIAGSQDFVDFFFHALFGVRVGAVEKNLVLIVEGANFFPCDFLVQSDGAGGDDVAEHLDAEFAQEEFGERSDGDAGSGLAGGGALENVAGFGKIVFQGSGEIGVARAGGGDPLVFCGIASGDGEGFLPIFPVAIGDLQGDGGTDGDGVSNAGENVGGIALDLHASAAAVALLAAPQLAVDEGLIDFQAGGHA
jgi:hypothetical protein